MSVWVVEGGSSYALGSYAAFDLRVDPNGWTLIDTTGTSVERLWSWDTIGGLEVVRGVGKTPDGRPATALDVIVNGWPVRVLIPTQDLPNETIAMLGAFAPVGHPLRASLRVKREPAFRRFTDAGRRITGERLRARPAFLLSAASTRLRSALVVGLVLAVTVAVASIAGVATSAQAPGPVKVAARNPTTTKGTGSVPATGDNPSAQVPATSSAITTPPAVAASGAQVTAGATSTTKAPAKKSSKKSTKKATTTKTTTTTKAAVATKPITGTTGPTSQPTAPGTTPPTTPGTVATTTTTRPRRPPTTTTTQSPSPTTTRPRRPPTTTTQPAPTTTQAAPPTTQAETTTTAAAVIQLP
ncbi:MAG: hypothetical protein ABSC30_15375 [Acidimicrobiales bacterium]